MDKLTKIVLSVLGVVVVIVAIVAIIANVPHKNENYDISMFKEVTIKDILGMFEDGGTYVVMIGSDSCEVCEHLLPKMAEAQKELNYITQYIDVFDMDFETDEWKALKDKLDMKSSQTLTEDGTGDKITETYGYFIENYMMTPTVMIIKDGKQTGGFIGGVDQTDLIGWLKVKVSNKVENEGI